MSDPDAYIALVTSLPSSERLFVAKQAPLSRLRLDRRLSALSPQDQETLRQIETFMSWSAYGMADDAATSIARARAVLDGLQSETIRSILQQRVDMRAVIAALRIRRNAEAPPPQAWSASRLTRHMLANWSDPTFKLDRHMPWLREAVTLFENEDPLGLERHILDVTFRQLRRHAARHQFDFEAVVIYVLKWNIFDRWDRSDARAAASRFEALAQEALGEFADPPLEGAA